MKSVLLVGCLVVCGAAGAAGESVFPTQAVDDYVSRYVQMGDFAGCVLIGRAETTLFKRCYGEANRELGVAHTPRSRFRIGSISKQLTAAGILVLEQQGKLSTTDPVSRHLPGYPRGDEITLHHLLTHTAGVPNALALEGYTEIKRQTSTTGELVAIFRDAPLDFAPGQGRAYSNSGYMLLAHLIERISGMSYGEFLARHVFEPAGMQQTGHEVGGRLLPRRADGYDPSGLRDVENASWVDPSASTGAGSIYSTVEDLQRWSRALETDRPLTAASRKKMLTDQGHGYGYGVAVYEVGGRRLQAHDGRVPGFSSDLSRYPDDGVVVVVLSNVQSGLGDAFRRDLRRIVFGDEYELPEPRTAGATADRGRLRELVGRYEFGPGFVVTAYLEGERFWVNTEGGEPSELVQEKPGIFLSRATYARVEFESDDAGKTTAMFWIQDGNRFRGARLSS